MKRYFIYLFAAMLVSMLARTATAQYSIPSKMDWWYEARFGMFIHFGSYSYLGHGEWAYFTENWTKGPYQSQVTSNFNPVDFNGGTIARLAKKAGMKYLVITAKHHEGFSMWDTEVESFKDVTGTYPYDLPGFTAFTTRDILQELMDSCEAQGIKFCLYYSIMDWCHSSQEVNRSSYYSDMASFVARTAYINDMKLQLNELITKYHPAVLWFDGDWTEYSGTPTLSKWWTKNDGIDLYNYMIGLDSGIIVNERVCRSFGLGDFECPERTIPDSPRSRQWETCQTMNKSWGYNSSDDDYKTPAKLIEELVKVVSRDGNYLLNIGPKGDGTVPAQTTEILESIGEWMSIYGESLYGATRSPFSEEPSWGFYTKKPGKIYLHVFTWPTNGSLTVPSPSDTVKRIFLMNDSANLLNFSYSDDNITISIPENMPNPYNSVIVMDTSLTDASVLISKITVTGEGGSSIITGKGGTLQMLADIEPTNASDKSLTWSVSDTSIASISVTGLLSGKKNGSVYVIASANDGSNIQGQLIITIDDITNIGHEVRNDDNISLFPNPVEDGILNIKQAGRSTLDVTIYNVNGQQVLKQKMSGKVLVLEVSDLLPGVYSVKVSDGENVITRKFNIK